MPTIQKRHNRSGSISFVAWVRIKPFKPMSKAFSTREAAKDWAEDQARQLMLQEPRGRVRFLSDEEMDRLLKAAHAHSMSMYVAILFSIATGVRMSELRRCRWSDVELDKQQVRILLAKNGEARGGICRRP